MESLTEYFEKYAKKEREHPAAGRAGAILGAAGGGYGGVKAARPSVGKYIEKAIFSPAGATMKHVRIAKAGLGGAAVLGGLLGAKAGARAFGGKKMEKKAFVGALARTVGKTTFKPNLLGKARDYWQGLTPGKKLLHAGAFGVGAGRASKD